MSWRGSLTAPRGRVLLAAACLALAQTGCFSVAGLNPPDEPALDAAANPERAAAVAEMRAAAEAGGAMPFPDAFQAEQTRRLALRGEPRSLAEVQAIEAELALIAKQRAAAQNPREIAALKARARELRRLAMAEEIRRQ